MNEDERASQLSAMFDGELPAAECELLSRRLARDERLRASWSRYAVIGAALRAEPLAQVRPDFARRVAAVLDGAPAAVRGGRARTLRTAALGGAVAAGVASVAILLLRNGLPAREAALTAAAVAPPTVSAAASVPVRVAAVNLRDVHRGTVGSGREMFSYVVPPAGNDNSLAVPATLADYVVAHSEVSSSLARGNLLSILVGDEAVQPAPSTMSSDGRP
jgi:anti-sigma factor RsiW